MKQNQLGRSMIEMLGVLAIIGVLSVGGIDGYSKAMEKFKTNKVIDQITTIVSNINILFANQTEYRTADYDYASSDIDAEIQEIINPEYYSGNNQHALGGYMEIGLGKHYFYIALEDLSKSSCISLSTYNWGGKSSGLIGIGAFNEYPNGGNGGYDIMFSCPINDTTSNSNDIGKVTSCRTWKNNIISLPLTPELGAKACSCSSNTCSVVLAFQ